MQKEALTSLTLFDVLYIMLWLRHENVPKPQHYI